MDESGAHGACRGARRLARLAPGSGAIMIWMRSQVLNMLAPGLLVAATPGIARNSALAPMGMKKPPPRSGDERCQARGTTPLRGRIVVGHLYLHGTTGCDAATR
jgi:hypothetical protein